MGEWDAVEFVGPASPVLRWPEPSEHGVIARVGDPEGTVHIVWERSTTVLAWPVEWVRKVDDPAPE
jgi:hypothetical protein